MAGPSRRRRLALYAAAGLFAGGVAVAVGPGAAWLVDSFADGRRVWRLGLLDVDGVTGSWLGDLRAKRASLADADGIWLEARDLELKWRPFDLLAGRVRIETGRAEEIALLRAPALSPARAGGGGVDVDLRTIEIAALRLEQPVVGEAATFQASLSLAVAEQRLDALALTLARLDSDADRLEANYARDFALQIALSGDAGGVFARALGVPDRDVSASATGDGNSDSGATHFRAAIGDAPVLSGDSNWSASAWSLQAQAQLGDIPPLEILARRIGGNLQVNASGARARRFNAKVSTNFIALDLDGELDHDFRLVGPATFVASTARLSDIAREAPFSFGPARLEGSLRRAHGDTNLEAMLHAEEIDALGQRTRLSGPIEAKLTAHAFTLSGDLRAPQDAPALFSRARLTASLRYDRDRQRFALERAELVGDSVRVDASGWTNRGEGEFAGAWRARRLEAFVPGLTGEAEGRWRALSRPGARERIWHTNIDGVGARIAGDAPLLPQMLGARPRFDLLLRNEDGGVTVAHASLDGAQLRAGARGRIVGGEASLSLEASARGPLNLSQTEIAGGIDATGRLSGPIARPRLSARAAMSSLSLGGIIVDQPALEVTLTPGARAYSGNAALTGAVSGQALTAASEVALSAGRLHFPALEAKLGSLTAHGEATLGDSPSAQFEVAGALDGLAAGLQGRVNANVAYAPDAVRIDARIADARAGLLQVRAANLHAAGPPDALAARFDLTGRLREAALSFSGAAAVNADGGIDITGEGALAGVALATRTPLRARFADNQVEIAMDIALGGGVLTALWRERGRALSGSAQVENAPLAPLAAIWGERAQGRIGGALDLASDGRGLSGHADLALSEARFAGRQRGTLNLRIRGELQPNRLNAEIDASSSDGLSAHFEADAPVVTSAAPIRIALAPERTGRARWSVNGAAESLWAATRLADQNLSGQLSGQGELQFGAAGLSGDGHIEIAEGRFEDKTSAISLIDLNARIALDQRGATIERFTAAGARGGRLSASGGSANPREGRVAIRLDAMRLVNRPDARATASGDLSFAWEGLHSTLIGALDISEAEIDAAANPEAGIPSLEVVEINRPGDDDWSLPEPPQPQRNGSTVLDVAIRAPGRVFTRGRGVEAEWALDLRLDGTARHPRLYGDARAVRGTLALSGQPFEIESARIFFNGDPLDAQIDLTAQRDSADLSARIRLTGTARDPELAFSSNPALPEDEILPQILFGRGVEDLSPFEAAQLAASLAALSGRASLDLVDAARAAAGLDRFNVRQDESGGFLVAGGIYLTRDVYVELARTGLGQAQSRVEWTVRPRLVLVTSFIDNGDQRVSLRWRRESD